MLTKGTRNIDIETWEVHCDRCDGLIEARDIQHPNPTQYLSLKTDLYKGSVHIDYANQAESPQRICGPCWEQVRNRILE